MSIGPTAPTTRGDYIGYFRPCISSGSVESAAAAIVAWPRFPRSRPKVFKVDGRKRRCVENCGSEIVKAVRNASGSEVLVRWGGDEVASFICEDNWIKYRGPRDRIDVEELCSRSSAIPFSVLSVVPMYVWFTGEDDDYVAPSFWGPHWRHGWACAFKKEGHANLVSRRWLHQPFWRLIPLPGDLSVIQFHELGVDSESALSQVRLGHARMGITPIGGFLHPSFTIDTRRPEYFFDFSPHYSDQERALVVRTHEPVEQGRMLGAKAWQRWSPLEARKPIEGVKWVFSSEELARAHLREMWLREIEVFYQRDGVEHRVDSEYQPPPFAEPDWVKRERDKDGL